MVNPGLKKSLPFQSPITLKQRRRSLCLVGLWVALISGTVGIVAAIFFTLHIWEHCRLKFPPNLGNARAANLIIQPNTLSDPLKFAVIGDIQSGTETFEDIVARLREEDNIAFLILLGDCAVDPVYDLHIYFIDEFAETNFNLPTFIVAGNHDVEPGRFGYPEFEELYGPANFAFLYRECLFIGLGGIHDKEKLTETLSFLKKTLQEKRSLAKKVFVFMHYPPAPPDYVPDDCVGAEAFQNLFEQYKVTYVLSGHHHRLARTNVNGVVYLITGGGGAKLRKDKFRDLGLFHHLTIIEVGGDKIAEYFIPIPPASWLSMLPERIERMGLTFLMPWFRQHTSLGILVLVIFVGMSLWAVTIRCRRRIPDESLRNGTGEDQGNMDRSE